MYYFAYGSNLSQRQMAKRCPDARPKFRATLAGHELVFTGWSSTWHGAVASIRPCKNNKVIGAIYEISDTDLKALDICEGCPTIYQRMKVKVTTEDAKDIEAVSYVKVKENVEAPPSQEYLATIQEGYQQWGLDRASLPTIKGLPG